MLESRFSRTRPQPAHPLPSHRTRHFSGLAPNVLGAGGFVSGFPIHVLSAPGLIGLAIAILGLLPFGAHLSMAAPSEPPTQEQIARQLKTAAVSFEPRSECRVLDTLSAETTASVVGALSTILDPLLTAVKDSEQRKRVARYLGARMLETRGIEKSLLFSRIETDLSRKRPELAVSALYDLDALVVLTAQMRNSRATLATLKPNASGEIELMIRIGPINGSLASELAPVVRDALDHARDQGVDCTATPLYAYVLSQAPERSGVHYSEVRQDDLRGLRLQIDTLRQSFLSRVATAKPPPEAGDADFENALQLVQTVQIWYDKALEKLTLATQLYRRTGNLGLEQTQSGELETLASAASALPNAPETSPTPDAPATSQKTAVGLTTSTPIPQLGGEAKKQAVLDEVGRQIEALRKQHGAEPSGFALRPSSVANNVLVRLKRIHGIAALLAAAETNDGAYDCSMQGGVVQIAFKQRDGKLTRMDVLVSEGFGDDTTLEWTMALDRKRDTEFRIDSEFNGVKGYVAVSNGAPERYPNYHQLLILMNRLDSLVDSTMREPDAEAPGNAAP